MIGMMFSGSGSHGSVSVHVRWPPLEGRKAIMEIMNAQIIAAAAGAAGAVITVGVTLSLALLNGFRRIYDRIDKLDEKIDDKIDKVYHKIDKLDKDNAVQFKDLRKAIAKNADAIAKNAEAIAGLVGSMGLIEKMLNTLIQAVVSKPATTSSDASTPANTPTSQTETEPERDARTAPAAAGR